jgi:hypothetical protein
MDDFSLLDRFEARTLTEFHHRHHIELTWLYLRRDGVEAGTRQVKGGIQALAAELGASEKYHETLTQFWIDQVAAAVTSGRFATFAAFVEACPELFDKGYVARFYRPETLASAAAKSGWVAPDLAPQA